MAIKIKEKGKEIDIKQKQQGATPYSASKIADCIPQPRYPSDIIQEIEDPSCWRGDITRPPLHISKSS